MLFFLACFTVRMTSRRWCVWDTSHIWGNNILKMSFKVREKKCVCPSSKLCFMLSLFAQSLVNNSFIVCGCHDVSGETSRPRGVGAPHRQSNCSKTSAACYVPLLFLRLYFHLLAFCALEKNIARHQMMSELTRLGLHGKWQTPVAMVLQTKLML